MYRAVIVEDEPWSLINIKSLFQWKNYNFDEPITFSSSKEALDQIDNISPDVIFTDINMPEISGLELIEKIRSHDNNVIIVIISGFDDFSYAQQAISYGVSSYLLKPLSHTDAENVMIKIKNILDKRTGSDNANSQFADIPNYTFRKLLQYINEHFNEKLQLDKLANMFYINESYGSQLFSKYLGRSFTEYITDIKMEKALDLLKTDMHVNEIAEFLSYDYGYFNKLFKKIYGMTPTQYRNKGENK